MIIKTMALFSTTTNTNDLDDLLSEVSGEVVESKETDTDGVEHTTLMYPTRFEFDMCDVIAINKSCYAGYSTIRYVNDSFSIKMPIEKLSRLFELCRG